MWRDLKVSFKYAYSLYRCKGDVTILDKYLKYFFKRKDGTKPTIVYYGRWFGYVKKKAKQNEKQVEKSSSGERILLKSELQNDKNVEENDKNTNKIVK